MINIKWKISPFNDFIFKKLFGTSGNEALLKPFLNAIFLDKDLPLVEELTILENRELVRDFFEEKLGVIAVHAKTMTGEIINIEVQLWNEYNIVKRTLFYWSKLYTAEIKRGQKYKVLPKVITINILDFNYFDEKWVHLLFRPTADVDSTLIMNELEIHFIQLPAFRKNHEKNFKTDELERWLSFLTRTINDEELEELLVTNKDISKAYDEIKHLLSDEEVVAIAEARERQYLDYTSAIEGAHDEGVIKTIQQFLPLIADDQQIAKVTGIEVPIIRKLREKHNATVKR